ncbi:hypothetical protein BJV82DRAFT_675233 [Fennellomyces sp. T-0311]|nr:hypothetical protein BJV82DRAFT_675233 [Fennellomyces sp. T-0311]
MNRAIIHPTLKVTRRTFYQSIVCSKENEGSVTQDLKGKKANKPYNEPQSASGTTDEIKEKDTAFDPETVDPHQEIREMGKESKDKKSPIEWSGANEKASPQNKDRES